MIVPMTAVETQALLGEDFVKTFQTEMDLIIAPLRKYIAKGYPLSMGKELWEYVVTDCIPKAVWNGAGKSLIDVSLGDNKGIDVKSVGRGPKAKQTAEASMYQSFDQDAKKFFEDRDAESLWNLYVQGWFAKADKFDEYYLLAIVREKETLDCSICGFKVIEGHPEYNADSLVFKKCSAEVKGMADPEFAKVRYYNSKSRLEILFQKNCWADPTYAFPIYKFEDIKC